MAIRVRARAIIARFNNSSFLADVLRPESTVAFHLVIGILVGSRHHRIQMLANRDPVVNDLSNYFPHRQTIGAESIIILSGNFLVRK
jgi:hypothetical protein